MKFKLDENFDCRLVQLLVAAGHDADTVRDEDLCGSSDELIYETCLSECRTLITLDLDFANPFRFPPKGTEGIIVVRPPRAVLPAIRETLLSILPQLEQVSVQGTLWIVEPGRIRIYDPDELLE